MKRLYFKKHPQARITECFTRQDIEEYFRISGPAAKAKIYDWYKRGYLKFAGHIRRTRIDGVKMKVPAYTLTPLGVKKLTVGGINVGSNEKPS